MTMGKEKLVRKEKSAPKKAAAVARKFAANVTKKGPSAKAARVMKDRAPKVIENTKNVIYLRGSKTSEAVGGLLKEMFMMRKPFGKMMQRKNENMHPFDEAQSVEFLCQKNDCSLFAIANHSKKRPNNLTLGRTFDGHVLDMVELGVESSTTFKDLQEAHPDVELASKRLGAKPCVVFLGEPWDASAEHKALRSLLLDTVRGQDVTGINLAALDSLIAFTAALDKVFMRTYVLDLRKQSDSAAPKARLILSAPAADFK